MISLEIDGGLIYPPCDTYALRGHRLEDYIHRGPIRGCGSNRAFNGIKFTELKVTTEIRRTRLTCFLRADGELFAGKTAAYFVVGVHADAVHAGRVQLHDVGLVVGGRDVPGRVHVVPSICKGRDSTILFVFFGNRISFRNQTHPPDLFLYSMS